MKIRRLVEGRVEAGFLDRVVAAVMALVGPCQRSRMTSMASASISTARILGPAVAQDVLVEVLAPVPTPRKNRPGISAAAVAEACAMIAGCVRMVRRVTPVPSRSVSVAWAVSADDRPDEGALSLTVDPGMEVIRDERVREPALLGGGRAADEINRPCSSEEGVADLRSICHPLAALAGGRLAALAAGGLLLRRRPRPATSSRPGRTSSRRGSTAPGRVSDPGGALLGHPLVLERLHTASRSSRSRACSA